MSFSCSRTSTAARVAVHPALRRSCRRGLKSAKSSSQPVAIAGWVRYGVKEEFGTDGAYKETYGLDLGGSIGRETLRFSPKSSAVALEVSRPLGIVFEEMAYSFPIKGSYKHGKQILAVDITEGSNAEKAGVKVGDILRMTSAVAVGKSEVSVGKWAVEPSLDMRKQGNNRRAYFVADNKPFDTVMDAIISNGEAVDGEEAKTVSLLLERPDALTVYRDTDGVTINN
eukprot:CAMPEP_0198197388 /NCGR_PEP_ID=MMETSP1445-20131203/1020_1 /TAXON_ID=36898 /ORGANISM="Pyramimonas sp., Strain CCMP2087" /LENGTH=226 /DNA_ID=CAMNT_0043866667 /DNA_START=117 /DNA_END=797 /DNA_ORIENTATION=+